MNDDARFERVFADGLHELAPTRAPDRLAVQVRVASGDARPRARWLAFIKEPPMRISSRVAVGSPTARLTAIAISLMALLVLAAGGLIGGAKLLAAPATVSNGLIAYDTLGDIWVANPDGTEPRQLTSAATLEHGATWSRDGSRIAYWVRGDASAQGDMLVVAGADGSDPRTIATHDRGRSAELTATRDLDWSPDGRHIAYSLCSVADPSCEEGVFVSATDGSGTSRVGDAELTAWRPRWSPDGSVLAFSGRRGDMEQGVYLMAPDGSDVHRISLVTDDGDFGFFSVSWSPDGATIATTATPGIWLIPVGAHDTADEVELVSSDAVVPMWSPDGSQVAYVDLSGSRMRIVPATGGTPTELGPVTEGGYAWSPDGSAIVVQRCFSGGCGFEIVDSATGARVGSIVANAVGRYPSWQPLTK